MKNLKFRIWDKQLKNFIFQLPEKHHLEWERFNTQQWTGLLDKNGKEIYEGDIVKVDWEDYKQGIKIYIVCWWNHGWYISYSDDKKAGYEMFPYRGARPCSDLIEIIGNIYENKDLLTKSE